MSTDLIKVKVIPNAVIWVPMLAKGSSTTSQQNTKSNRDHCKSPLWILEGTLCSLTLRNIAIFTARKQSLRRLCFYTCLSVILFMGGRVWWWGECAWQGEGGMHDGGYAWWECAWQGACMPHTPTLRDTVGQCAGGTHPTVMHSCLKKWLWFILERTKFHVIFHRITSFKTICIWYTLI